MSHFHNLKGNLLRLGCMPNKNPPNWLQKLENLLEHYGFVRILKLVRKCSQQKVRIGVIFSFLFISFLTGFWFLLFEAKQFDEFSEAVYFVSVWAMMTLCYSSFVLHKDTILNHMNEFNNMITASK